MRKIILIFIFTVIAILVLLVGNHFTYATIDFYELNNVFLVILIWVLTILLVYVVILTEDQIISYFILILLSILIFIARAVPNVRLSYPILQDSCYHFICTLNILEYGTLDPILGWWYLGVDRQLNWPGVHLLTAFLAHITNIDALYLFKFQQPLLGILFFLAMYIFAKTVTKNEQTAIISALIASTFESIIYYQSEYHPQGFAITIFVFILYTLSKFESTKDLRYICVILIFEIIFVLSHYFTPLFFSLVFATYIFLFFILIRVYYWSPRGKLYMMLCDIKYDCIFLAPVIIGSTIYYLLDMTNTANEFLNLALNFELHSLPFISSKLLMIVLVFVGLLIPVLVFYKINQNSKIKFAGLVAKILRVIDIDKLYICFILLSIILMIMVTNTVFPIISKILIFVLSILSIFGVLKTNNHNEFRLIIIFFIIVFAGAFGYYAVHNFPLDRIISFYYPFAAIFASLSLFKIKERRDNSAYNGKKLMFIIILLSIIVFGGILNAHKYYYLYNSSLPNTNEYKETGEWINENIAKDSNIGVVSETNMQFDPFTAAYFYGRHYDIAYIYSREYSNIVHNSDHRYMLVDHTKSWKLDYYRCHFTKVYDSKELKLYSN